MSGLGWGYSAKMLGTMSSDEYEELYLASVRVPLVLAMFLGLWGLVILVLQALQIDFSSVLRKASGRWRGGSPGGGSLTGNRVFEHTNVVLEISPKTGRIF